MKIELIKNSLETLAADTPAQFGIMTPQHMIEHLTVTVKISYGRIKIPNFELSEKQKFQKTALLDTNLEFPKGVMAPGMTTGELTSLRNTNLFKAQEQLQDSILAYHAHFTSDPTATTVHPRFGQLTYVEWERFHRKHFKHHFEQFGIWIY